MAIIVIFFTLQYPQDGNIGVDTIQTWWGNSVFGNTLDALSIGSAAIQLPKGGAFGPAPGTWK